MIAVTSPEQGTDQSRDRRLDRRTMQPVRSEHPGNNRQILGPSVRSGTSEMVHQLSRERSTRTLEVQHGFRNTSEDERDDELAFQAYPHPRPPYHAPRQLSRLPSHTIRPPPHLSSESSWSNRPPRSVLSSTNEWEERYRPYPPRQHPNPRDWSYARPPVPRPFSVAPHEFGLRSDLDFLGPPRDQNWTQNRLSNRGDVTTRLRQPESILPHSNSPSPELLAEGKASPPSDGSTDSKPPAFISVSIPPTSTNTSAQDTGKRNLESPTDNPPAKKPKGLDSKLDLLCEATLQIGPLSLGSGSCSCPRSKCIALYCDCFKAGRRCDPNTCSCVGCENTVAESGVNGKRSNAIRNILARNPRAFLTVGVVNRPKPGEACSCVKSRCLKLYCNCFQSSKKCVEACTCVGCYNTDENAREREFAIQMTLEKRPDAFEQKVRQPGLGCACKNNRCIRKYCECFRSSLACTKSCCCRDCQNPSTEV